MCEKRFSACMLEEDATKAFGSGSLRLAGPDISCIQQMSVSEGSSAAAAVCARPPNVSIWLGVSSTKVPPGRHDRARVKCRVFDSSAPHCFGGEIHFT
jgi:hypothetical protein